ncbi:hypothetical protein LTR62_008462 [Meristemomyces frigidus]|uniref:Uncharacterized protein n=1 Tax=Meristemomyces frigidus TaxID=1508187 RepID=A0AAN7TP26_9PEZI|nr:hypothetical protein LTR62_008462 [Meristemomyces frigidus]
MTTTQGRLESIYPALLAIVNNIAPYVKDLQRATSSKLLELFGSLSAPTFLLEKESNHLLLEQLLQALNAILEHQVEANRRFVDVVVRTRKRFYALRDFTVESALAEADQQALQRKDRGEQLAQEVRSPVRAGSIDSVRSPTSVRSPQLGNVPEHGAFAIGDDDDNEDDEADHDMVRSDTFTAAPLSASSSIIEEAVPLQSRSMSEKARGKQPVGQGSFSRSTSRNTSTASLPSLTAATSSNTQTPTPSTAGFLPAPPFTPTAPWIETWLPPLHAELNPFLLLIQTGGHAVRNQPALTPGSDTPLPPKIQTFAWTSLALGWYLSLIWGLVYAQDTAVNKGISGVWTGTGIRVFAVLGRGEGGGFGGTGISLGSPRGAVDAVGNALASRIGSLNLGGLGGGGGGVGRVTREV